MISYSFIDKEIEYTGAQLISHWIYKNHDIGGDAIVSFIGPCRVGIENMVDLEDVKRKDTIYSPRMLHFIIEFFDESLTLAVFRQRLFVVTIKEELERIVKSGQIIREGDDLHYVDGNDRRKLTVSIATRSPVSTLIHTAINIHTGETPVRTAGLGELEINPEQFAKNVMVNYVRELHDMEFARCKVRGVG